MKSIKNTSRRKFIQNTSLVTGGLLIAGRIGASKNKNQAVSLGCAPMASTQLTGTVASVTSGNWSDPGTWGGRVPGADDTPLVSSGHTVNYDQDSGTFAGININSGATLAFDSSRSTVLQSRGNILLEGKLQMRPDSASVIQTLRFTGINENNYVGGGMDPLDSDIGLWVMGNGQLDLQGASKTSWTRAVDTINAGSTSIALQAANGWAAGDEITIAPTDSPSSSSAYTFEDRTITGVSGSSVSLNSSVSRTHPKVNNQWTAEVINLTRNVRIEGTSTGKAHVFIRSGASQSVRFVQFRYMGPRKNTGGESSTELVLGRYGLHFHHCDDGSRNSVVEGSVMRDTDNHCYVAHVSHGIVFKSNASYNTSETPFWWDEGDSSHEIIYDSNIVANTKFVHRSLAVDTGDPQTPNLGVAGFLMGMGDDNVANGNVVVGTDTGDTGVAGAYFWQANNEGIWIFTNNVAHNNRNGLLTWQNSTKNHVIENTVIYNCGTGVVHGAYANSYTYKGGAMYANAFEIEASSTDTNRVRLENIAFDGAGALQYGVTVKSSPIPASYPTFIRGCSFTGFTTAGILDIAGGELKNIDVIQCTSSGTLAIVDSNATSQEAIRIQPAGGQTLQITKSDTNSIFPFAASVWGTGSGLKGEYYNSNNFTNKVVERVDSVLAFTEWSTGVHNKITGNNYSIRWTGQVQAQYSEDYTFQLQSGGAHRMWIDNKLVLDNWAEHYPDTYKTAPIRMVAGQKYDIKIEYYNTDERSAMGMYWSSPTQDVEYVPQSQLYSSDVQVSQPTPPPPSNQGPVANAGVDATIILPSNWVSLNGTGSADSDGRIVSYQWSAVSAPSSYNIQYPDHAETGVYNMQAGTYVFRLQVTDDKGATATDDVTITVQAAQQDPPPSQNEAVLTLTASPNPTTTSFRVTVSSTSDEPISVTIVDSWGNLKNSYTNLLNNTTGFVGLFYPRGTYYAIAQQGSVTTTIQLSKL